MEQQEDTAGSESRDKELADPLDQISPKPSMQAEETLPEKSSRLGRILSSALRWVVGFLIVFVFGVAATWFTRVRPQSQEILILREQLDVAQSENESLTMEVEDLRPLVAENANLERELANAEYKIALLNILVDLTSAQLALVEDDPLAASAALEVLDDRLEDLQKKLPDENAQAISKMRERLLLVMDELEGDAFAAKRDLEILSNDLVSLEADLFGD